MINNPFTSDTFSAIWAIHFSPTVAETRFGFLKNLQFVKHKYLPLYINNGKTHTKGVSYDFMENSCDDDLKGKVVLIYDVPVYFNIPEISNQCIKQYKIKQYPGFLINLKPYKNLNEFMVGTFKKSSRSKLKRYKRKLETCLDIHYKMFHGEISKDEYDFIFESFNKLLKKRFDDKQETNNNLEKQEWNFYFEVAYPMILDKKAGLNVIYNGTQPIGITLVYFSDEILFNAITVFDIDYAKFHVGSTTIMKLVEWSIEQKLKILDFSKGYFDYKKRWASNEYDFEYHILYDSKSTIAKLLAFAIKTFFEFKQFLRDKNVNEKLHKLTFWLRKKNKHVKLKPTYEFFEIVKDLQKEELVEINWGISENGFLKTSIFNFLYLNNESQKDLKVYKLTNDNSQFLFLGKEKNVTVKMSTK